MTNQNKKVTVQYGVDDKASGKIKNIDKSSRSAAAGFLQSKLAVGAMAAAVTAAVADFARLQTRMTDVGNLIGFNKDQVNEMTKELLELGKTVPVSTMDLADSLFDVVSAGVPAARSIEFLGVASKLAVAGVTDTRVAVDGLTSVINAYGLEASDAQMISDKFFAAQQKGKTTIEELSSTVGRLAPLAAAAGVSIDDMFASVSALTTQGVATAEAVTSVRSAITAVIKPTSEAKKEAERLGLEFNQAALESKGLTGFLEDVVNATDGNNESLATLFGRVEAVNGVLALSQGEFKSLKDVQDALSDSAGSTERAFRQQSNTIAFQANVLKNRVINTVREIILFFEPAIAGLIGSITRLFDMTVNGFKATFSFLSRANQNFARQAGRDMEKAQDDIKKESQKTQRELQTQFKQTTNIVKSESKQQADATKQSYDDMAKQGKRVAQDVRGAFVDMAEDVVDGQGGVTETITTNLTNTLGSDGGKLSSFLGGFLGGVLGQGILGIVNNIFGGGSGKSFAQQTQEAFDKMIRNTQKALERIDRDRSSAETQADLLEDILDVAGSPDAAIPAEFLQRLGVESGTTIKEAFRIVFDRVSGSINEEMAVLQNELSELQLTRDIARSAAESGAFSHNAILRFIERNPEMLNRIAQVTGSTGNANEIARAAQDFFARNQSGTGFTELAGSAAANQRIRELQQDVAASAELSVQASIDQLALRRRLAELEGVEFTFSTGGIVPGNRTVGDMVRARLNSGEMVLNKQQQSNMFSLLNNGVQFGQTTSTLQQLSGNFEKMTVALQQIQNQMTGNRTVGRDVIILSQDLRELARGVKTTEDAMFRTGELTQRN